MQIFGRGPAACGNRCVGDITDVLMRARLWRDALTAAQVRPSVAASANSFVSGEMPRLIYEHSNANEADS